MVLNLTATCRTRIVTLCQRSMLRCVPPKSYDVPVLSTLMDSTDSPPKCYVPPHAPKSYDKLPVDARRPPRLISRSYFAMRERSRQYVQKSTRLFPKKLRCNVSPQKVTMSWHQLKRAQQRSHADLEFRRHADSLKQQEIYGPSPQKVTMQEISPKKLRFA